MVASIHTYGGIDTLVCVFNAIAMLMKGGALIPIMKIAAMVGALFVFGKAFWESSFNGLLMHWLIPMVIIVGTCIVPTMPVLIEDAVTEDKHRIENIPIVLARAAQTISTLGFTLTKLVEQAFTLPGHALYSNTGMIFGAENVLEMGLYAITNEDLAESMRDFVHNCVTFDILFNLYSMDELKKAPNIWDLIKTSTSQVRMFLLCQNSKERRAGTESGEGHGRKQRRCRLISCREGASHLTEKLKKHTDGLASHHVLQHIGGLYNYFASTRDKPQKKSAADLIQQQVMIHTIIDAVERKCEASGLGTNFAIQRAYLQQRHTYEIVGALAAKSLVVLRNILEALLYASFLFIAPMALMPMGFKILLKWLGFLVWIQLWPPFYAILNSGIMMAVKRQAQHIPGIEDGLTFMTSIGLSNLSLDMQAYAAYTSLSIPFLSYALLQGSVSVLAQVAGGITGVSQSTGSAAAQDLTTGNYSYDNVQLDTLSYNNQTMHQHSLAPSLSHGHYTENIGDGRTIHTPSGMVIDDPVSQFGIELNGATMLSQGLRRSSNEEFAFAEQQRESSIQSQMEHIRGATEFMEHAAKGNGYDKSIAAGTNTSVTQASQEVLKAAESFGHKYNLDTKTASEFILNAGLGVVAKMGLTDKAKFEASFGSNFAGRSSASKDEMYEEAKNVYNESSFSKNFQGISHTAQNEQANMHDETGMRLSQSMSQSLEKSKQHQQQFEKHSQTATNLSALADITTQESASVNRRYNQEFVDYLTNQKMFNGHIRGKMSALCLLRHNPEDRDAAIGQFMDMKQKSFITRHDLSTNEGFKSATKELSNRSIAVASPVTPAVNDLPSSVKGPQDQKSSLLATSSWAAAQQKTIDGNRDQLTNQDEKINKEVTQHNAKIRNYAQTEKNNLETTVQEEKDKSTMGKAFLNSYGVTPTMNAIKSLINPGKDINTPALPSEYEKMIRQTDKKENK